jgi:hypothetical protein
VFSLGLCANGRDPPTSLDEAAVTVTLVETSRAGVDAWHKLLAASTRANVTDPEYSKSFEVCVCVCACVCVCMCVWNGITVVCTRRV